LQLVDEYQLLLYKAAKISEEEWNNDPRMSSNIDSKQAVQKVMLGGKEPSRATRLETALKSIILELESTPGYENLVKNAPMLFRFNEQVGINREWVRSIFNDTHLAWSVIYLDGLRTNLLLIKASVQKI